MFLEISKFRNSENLKNIIEKYVNEHSIVNTDEWKGYSFLKNANYIHKTVNHSKNFLNLQNSDINTQLIENSWKWFKHYLKKMSFRSTQNPDNFIYGYIFLKKEISSFEKLLQLLRKF